MYEIIGTGHIPPNPGWKIRAHSHADRNELIIPLDGILHLVSEELNTAAVPGELLVYPAGRIHDETADTEDPVDLLFISFKGNAGKRIRKIKDFEHRVRRLGTYLLRARERDPDTGLVKQYAEIICAESFAIEKETSGTLVSEVRSFMRRNMRQPLSVRDMAEYAHMSRYHFIRTYREQSGETPQADFRRIRIREAAHLLESTPLPIKAVAPMVGFVNEYHFSRVFKKIMGLPPGAYRDHEHSL